MPRLVHRELDARADAGVRNSQPAGIGRVVALPGLVCWNNLGRNVVFADETFSPLATFGTTLHPDEDEASQYDLDVHSILDVPEFGLVVVLNHFGTVRAFRRADLVTPRTEEFVAPTAVWSFVADVERTIAVAGRLVASAPRSDGALGLVVSDPLDARSGRASLPRRAGAIAFGEVSALGVVPSSARPFIAVGGDGKLALMPLVAGEVGTPVWETEVGFRVATIAWHSNELWAAGPDGGATVDDYDWESLRGGGFAALNPADGTTVMSGDLPEHVAWGTGGVAVVPFGTVLAVADRSGGLHLVDPHSGATQRATPPLDRDSLGIAHLAVVGQRVVCGFNRGGYHLHCFAALGAGADGS